MSIPDTPKNPLAKFSEIYNRAAYDWPYDHTACTLATASKDGVPSSRIILLKKFDHRGFQFYTNYDSRKSLELLENPNASLCFYWASINEQIRVDGTVSKVTPEESDEYFATRPLISQLGAWASHQSRELSGREELMGRVEQYKEKFGEKVPRPENWGGWLLRPKQIEFWHNGEFRLHDRFLYTRIDDSDEWEVKRLNP